MVAAAVDTYLAFLEADPEVYRFVVHRTGRSTGRQATRSAACPTSSATQVGGR